MGRGYYALVEEAYDFGEGASLLPILTSSARIGRASFASPDGDGASRSPRSIPAPGNLLIKAVRDDHHHHLALTRLGSVLISCSAEGSPVRRTLADILIDRSALRAECCRARPPRV